MNNRGWIRNANVWTEFYLGPVEEKVHRYKANWEEHLLRGDGTIYRESCFDISPMNVIVDRLLKVW